MKETGFVAYQHEVKAILEGRQTMFRRVIKPQPTTPPRMVGGALLAWVEKNKKVPAHIHGFACPYGQVGDRLWVRETWGIMQQGNACSGLLSMPTFEYEKYDMVTHERYLGSRYRVVYRATGSGILAGKWRPSIHMPRWASRITLEITGVKVERIQDISLRDIISQGLRPPEDPTDLTDIGQDEFCADYLYRKFRELWNSINAKRGYGWDVNPRPWCLTFKVVNE